MIHIQTAAMLLFLFTIPLSFLDIALFLISKRELSEIKNENIKPGSHAFQKVTLWQQMSDGDTLTKYLWMREHS